MQDKKNGNDSLKKFFEENTKKIVFGTLSDDLKVKFKSIIFDLDNLKTEIELKKNLFLEKMEHVNRKVDDLKNKGVIKLNEEVIKKIEAGLENYKKLLNHFVSEIEYELSFCKSIISDKPPEHLRIFKGAVEDPKVQLNFKIFNLKKYIKKTKKDVRISFSRYNFDFDEQMRKLDYVSMYLKNVKKQPSVKA